MITLQIWERFYACCLLLILMNFPDIAILRVLKSIRDLSTCLDKRFRHPFPSSTEFVTWPLNKTFLASLWTIQFRLAPSRISWRGLTLGNKPLVWRQWWDFQEIKTYFFILFHFRSQSFLWPWSVPGLCWFFLTVPVVYCSILSVPVLYWFFKGGTELSDH